MKYFRHPVDCSGKDDYIRSIYGNYILSGQQESTWKGTPDYEINYVKEKTDRIPVIRGLDYINQDFDGVTQRSMEWWEQGGIVSICWHWGTPQIAGCWCSCFVEALS